MVIQAQLRRRRKSRNQRSDARRTMQLLTAGRTPDGKSTEVLIHDLSTGGFLMQTTAAMALGDIFEVVLPRTGTREVEVVWASGTFFGCRFLVAVPPGSVSAALLKSVPSRSAEPHDHATSLPQFGERLTALRVSEGLTLDSLADRLGVSRQAVWYWETGQRLPRPEHFKKIAAAFNVPETALLDPQPRHGTGDHLALIHELKREIARQNGVDEDKIKIIIEL